MLRSAGTSTTTFNNEFIVPQTQHEAADTDIIFWKFNDPENPFNFPLWKKTMICFILCAHTTWVTMCSSGAAAIAQEMQEEFNLTPVVSRLPVAMFLFGMALGPVILTPLAEDYGRKKVLTICLTIVCE
ncbi:hypothetical protein DXG01_017200 [Tephrocybe rancida]|nr:hypothetical protein DXG01_017200 [Tephrocybe rancida]